MPNQADQAIAFARAQIGKWYVFGAAGPDTYDCSGLVMAAYAHATPPIRLTHFTGTMVAQGTAVAQKDLKPGDLVFPDAGHVQLYTGNGMVVEAPHSGAKVREVHMWGFWRGRRVAGTPGSGGGTTPSTGAAAPTGGAGVAEAATGPINFLMSAEGRHRISFFILGSVLIIFAVFHLFKDTKAVRQGVKTAKHVGHGIHAMANKVAGEPQNG